MCDPSETRRAVVVQAAQRAASITTAKGQAMSHDIVLRLKGSRVLGHMQPHEDGTLDLWITNEKGVTSLGKTLPAAVARKFMSELNPKRPDSIFWAYLGKSRLPDWKAQGRRINPEQAYIQPAWAFNTRTDRACRRS